MRIRTEGEYAYRRDTIEEAADFWGVGDNTNAILKSCDLAGRVLPQLIDAIDEADIRPSEKQKLLEALNTRHVSAEFEPASVSIAPDDGADA